jgi:hypothetical protein
MKFRCVFLCLCERERSHASARPIVICVMYCSRELNQYVLLVANSPSIFVDTSCRDMKRPRLVVHRCRDSCMKNGALGQHSCQSPSPHVPVMQQYSSFSCCQARIKKFLKSEAEWTIQALLVYQFGHFRYLCRRMC